MATDDRVIALAAVDDIRAVTAVEQVIVKALEKSVERSADAATEVFSSNRAMARKVTEEIEQANKVLIVNLSALR